MREVLTIVTYRNPYANLSTAQVAYLALSRAIKVMNQAPNKLGTYHITTSPAVTKLMSIRENLFSSMLKRGINAFTDEVYELD